MPEGNRLELFDKPVLGTARPRYRRLRIAGKRSWISTANSVVSARGVNSLGKRSPTTAWLQFPTVPPNRKASHLSYDVNCLACTFARHSKKPSTGTMQRRKARADFH